MHVLRSGWWPTGRGIVEPLVSFGAPDPALKPQYAMYRKEMMERPQDWTAADRAEIRRFAVRDGYGHLIPE